MRLWNSNVLKKKKKPFYFKLNNISFYTNVTAPDIQLHCQCNFSSLLFMNSLKKFRGNYHGFFCLDYSSHFFVSVMQQARTKGKFRHVGCFGSCRELFERHRKVISKMPHRKPHSLRWPTEPMTFFFFLLLFHVINLWMCIYVHTPNP